MSFERARNEENKKIRMEQIKEAAIYLFDTMPYYEITLSKISNKINFTRGNLYKYISSKEDVYIYIMMDELESLVVDMENNLIDKEKLDTKTLGKKWAEILYQHPRYLKLSSLLFTMIEQNANVEVLIEFKNKFVSIMPRMASIFKHNIPEFNDEDVMKFIHLSSQFIASSYPLCHPTEVQREAVERSNYNADFPNFIDSFSEVVIYLINGIKLSKM